MFDLENTNELRIQQRKELAELIGFETRNKYELTYPDGRNFGFAAEQKSGFLGALLRHFLGHWRTFDIHLFDQQRQTILIAHHPFRWFFNRLEIKEAQTKQPIGAIQQRFAIISKKFDVEDARGRVVLKVKSPLWSIWTFRFKDERGRERAMIQKKWSGLLKEMVTDADNFRIVYNDADLGNKVRNCLLAAALLIDLQYFEKKGSE